MHVPDMINGAFEGWGAVVQTINVFTLLRDKKVRGFHLGPMIFFTSWSVWNCWYYPHLHQFFSLAGGATMGLMNVVYTSLAFYYVAKERHGT